MESGEGYIFPLFGINDADDMCDVMLTGDRITSQLKRPFLEFHHNNELDVHYTIDTQVCAAIKESLTSIINN